MLTDPRPALAEQSGFVNGLVGLASLAPVIRALGSVTPPRVTPPDEADDFVHLLLAVVSFGEAIARLAEPEPGRQPPGASDEEPSGTQAGEWLR